MKKNATKQNEIKENDYNPWDEDYMRALSAAYWEEEDEFKAGIHPTQVRERIEQILQEEKVQYDEITYMRWLPNNKHVEIHLDGSREAYGIFDYYANEFISAERKAI